MCINHDFCFIWPLSDSDEDSFEEARKSKLSLKKGSRRKVVSSDEELPAKKAKAKKAAVEFSKNDKLMIRITL